MQNSLSKSGDLRVETIRGFAILAVVAHHATLFLRSDIGVFGADAGFVNQLVGWQSGFLQPIRMPLFTFISGWVYALRPVSPHTALPFISGKIRRILIPLFVVSSLTYFFFLATEPGYPQIAVPDLRPVMPAEFWLSWFFHVGHLWFLQALLTVFIVVMLLDLLGWMGTTKQWLLWLLLGVLVYAYLPGVQFMSLYKVPDILVFFLAGVGAKRFSELWVKKEVLTAFWVIFTIAMLSHVVWKLTNESFDPRLHFLAVGVVGPICLIYLNFVWAPLVWIGGYSYAIFLYHLFGFRAVSWLDSLIEINPSPLLWIVAAMVSGVLLPILLDFIVRRIPFVRTALVGRKS